MKKPIKEELSTDNNDNDKVADESKIIGELSCEANKELKVKNSDLCFNYG